MLPAFVFFIPLQVYPGRSKASVTIKGHNHFSLLPTSPNYPSKRWRLFIPLQLERGVGFSKNRRACWGEVAI